MAKRSIATLLLDNHEALAQAFADCLIDYSVRTADSIFWIMAGSFDSSDA